MYILQANINTLIKEKPIQSSLLSSQEIISIAKDKELKTISLELDKTNHYKIEYNNSFKYIFAPHWNIISQKHILTIVELTQIYNTTKKEILEEYLPYLNKVIETYEINKNLNRLKYFLAQIGHESGGLKYKEELASGEAYENRKDLGNIYLGDGKRYKGRGIIQITGRHNYTRVSKELKIDIVNNPEKASQPDIACLIAGWYWNSRNLNYWADKNDFKKVTKLINGGYNGLEDRLKYLQKAELILK